MRDWPASLSYRGARSAEGRIHEEESGHATSRISAASRVARRGASRKVV